MNLFQHTLMEITPKLEQVQWRVGVLSALEQLILSTFNGQAGICLVGSSASGTELVSSDLDVTVSMPGVESLIILRSLMPQIQSAAAGHWAQYHQGVHVVFSGGRVDSIESARIPIIKE